MSPARRPVAYLDDYDLSQLGLVVERVDGLGDQPDRPWPSAPLPKSERVAILSTAPDETARLLVVRGHLLADTVALRNVAFDTLKGRCFAGDTVRLRFVDQGTREWVARCIGIQVDPRGQQFIEPGLALALSFVCESPYGRDTSDSVVDGITTTLTAIPLGTAPSRPLIRITGPATNPLLAYAHFDATVLQTLQLTGSIAGGDYVEIDMDRMTITQSVASVLSSALTMRTAGSFFALDPAAGSYAAAQWPTVNVSSGTARVTYRKRWR